MLGLLLMLSEPLVFLGLSCKPCRFVGLGPGLGSRRLWRRALRGAWEEEHGAVGYLRGEGCGGARLGDVGAAVFEWRAAVNAG